MVIDTSAWIEWLLKSQTSELLAPHWPKPETCIVPTIVQLELTKVLVRMNLSGQLNAVLASMSQCEVVDLDTELAIWAAAVCANTSLSTADAIVYATARRAKVPVLTTDAHFEDMLGVIYIPKIQG